MAPPAHTDPDKQAALRTLAERHPGTAVVAAGLRDADGDLHDGTTRVQQGLKAARLVPI